MWKSPSESTRILMLKSLLPPLSLSVTTSREEHFLLLLCLIICICCFPESCLTYDGGNRNQLRHRFRILLRRHLSHLGVTESFLCADWTSPQVSQAWEKSNTSYLPFSHAHILLHRLFSQAPKSQDFCRSCPRSTAEHRAEQARSVGRRGDFWVRAHSLWLLGEGWRWAERENIRLQQLKKWKKKPNKSRGADRW